MCRRITLTLPLMMLSRGLLEGASKTYLLTFGFWSISGKFPERAVTAFWCHVEQNRYMNASHSTNQGETHLIFRSHADNQWKPRWRLFRQGPYNGLFFRLIRYGLFRSPLPFQIQPKHLKKIIKPNIFMLSSGRHNVCPMKEGFMNPRLIKSSVIFRMQGRFPNYLGPIADV